MNIENNAIIIISVSLFFMLYFVKQELNSYKDGEIYKDYKSVIISIGVLGTFIGIVLGLLEFDTKDAINSIPNLLNGLKTAFITSIIGMIISIVLSAKSIKNNKKDDDETILVNIDNNISKIPALLDLINEKQKKQEDSLVEIKKELEPLKELLVLNDNVKALEENSTKELSKIDESIEKQNTFISEIPNINVNLKSINDQQIQSNEYIAEHITKTIDNIQNRLEPLKELLVLNDNVKSMDENMTNRFIEIQKNTEPLNNSLSNISNTLTTVNENISQNNKTMHQFLDDKLKDVILNLQQAVETLSKGATQEIIKALEQVIVDFNSNLTEQFGESFSKLNEAVFNLIQWQENYKNQISDFEDSLSNTLENVLNSNTKSIEIFKQETNSVSKIFEKETLTVLETFSELTKSAEYIDKITKDYESISKTSQDLKEIIEVNNAQLKDFKTHTQTLVKLGKDAGLVTSKIDAFAEQIIGSITNQSTQIGKQSESLTSMMREIEEKLPASLNILNKNLTSLSEHFTENYKKLLNSLLAENN